jgi:hypothetical protein
MNSDRISKIIKHAGMFGDPEKEKEEKSHDKSRDS